MEEAQTSTAGAVADAPLPTISEPASLVGVFVNPRGTFTAMSSKPRFLLAAALVVVVQVVLSVLIFQSGAVKNDAVAKMEAKGTPQEQIDRMQTFFDSPAAPIIGATSGAVVIVILLLLNAGLMFFMGNLMLGAQLAFRHYFSVATYSFLIGIVDQGVRTALAWNKGTMDIRLGLGNLLGEDMGHLGHMLDTLTDPLVLWSVLVSAIGVSAYARKKLGFGILAVLPGFLVNVLLSGMR
jgi:hypothetical protein